MVEYGSWEKIVVHSQQAPVAWEYVPSYSAELLEGISGGRRKNFYMFLSSVMILASCDMSTKCLGWFLLTQEAMEALQSACLSGDGTRNKPCTYVY